MQYTDELQYAMDISDSANAPSFARVTENTAFNPAVNREEYSPKYKCVKVQPKFSAGKSIEVDVDIDLVDEQELQTWFVAHEDDDNVPTKIVRYWAKKGTPAARPAKMADFLWNPNQIDGEASNPLKATGKLSMTSDGWVKGTYDETSKAFTQAVG